MRSASVAGPTRGGALGTYAREAALVAAALAVVYLVTMTGNHGEAEDSLGYAAGIRAGGVREVLNPNHMAWGGLGWVVYNAARGLGVGSTPLPALQAMDALLGAAGVGMLWAFLRPIGWTRTGTAAACGLLAFSYGYWFYSGEAEVYMLAATLLIGCLIAAHAAARRPSVGRFALVGLVNGLAVLGHATNVLFAFVVVAALWWARGRAPGRELLRAGAAYAGTAVAVVVAAYSATALAIGFGSLSEVHDWITQDTGNGAWGHLEATNVPKGAVGVLRALEGGHPVFAVHVGHVFERVGGRNPREELFMMRDFPDALAAVLLVAGAAAIAVIVGLLFDALRRRPWRPARPDAPLGVLCIAWVVPYALFFLWWEPLNIEFWIAVWIPLALLFASPFAFDGAGVRRRRMAFAAIAVLALVNLVGSILPQQQRGGDYWRARTAWFERHSGPRDLVLTNGYVPSNYLSYFTRARVVDANVYLEPSADRPSAGVFGLQTTMARSHAARFLADDQAFRPGAARYSSCRGSDECRNARVLREWFLPGTRVVARTSLSTIRELPLPRAGERPH